MKVLKFRTKNALFWYFWSGTFKNYCHTLNQCPQIFITTKFCAKIKILKYGTIMSYLVVLGINFENNIFIFEISTLEFVLLQSLLQK